MRRERPLNPNVPQLKPTVYVTALPELASERAERGRRRATAREPALSKPSAAVRRIGAARVHHAPPETDESRRS